MGILRCRVVGASLAITLAMVPQVHGKVPPDSSVTRHVETVRVADRIYAFIAPESFGGLVSGNSMVVIGDSAVLVVDSGHFPLVTRQMITAIRRLTTLPVRYLANTHWHPDHWIGNAEYRRAFPEVTILSTEVTRAEMERQGPDYVSRYQDSTTLRKLRELANEKPGSAQRADVTEYYAATLGDLEDALEGWRGVTLTLPTLTFDRSLTLQLGGREAQVMFLGRGNTADDAVVLVPDAKVVATGDLVVSPTPYAYESFFKEWIEVLGHIEALGPKVIVPGHGPVQHNMEYVRQLVSLLTYARAKTGEAVRMGLDLKTTRRLVDLEPYRRRFAGNDVRRRRLFDIGFAGPGIKGEYDRVKAERLRH